MRVTKTQLKPEVKKDILELVDRMVTVNDFTLAVDFAEDAYSLFAEELSKRKIFKGFWQLFKDVRQLYTKYKIGDLMKNFDFYSRIRNFLRYFVTSNLFYELDKLDPMEALEQFLKMFQPPQKQPPQKQSKKQKQQSGKGKPKQKEEEKKKEDKKKDKQDDTKQSPTGKSDDQKGLSASEDNLPIDVSDFRQKLPQIEKALDSGLLDRDDIQEYVSKHAGVGSSELKIGNIKNIVDKLASDISQKELDIFYVARKKELTDKYRREEILKSVSVPDNEMSVKSMSNYQEMIKILPGQYALSKPIFNRKLIDKELQVRDYQSRRLKKQALYLLIDVSGSMQGVRNIYASGVALSLVRQAVDEGSTYFLRFFDDQVKNLHKVTNNKEAKEACEILVKQPFSGGGTNIERAIRTAVKDITDDPEGFEKAEIMLITDGEDNVGMIKDDLKGIKLHSTVISGHNLDLEKLSETFTELDTGDLQEIL